MPNNNNSNGISLGYIASRVLDTPLMITRAKLDQILDVIGGRIGLELHHDPKQYTIAPTKTTMIPGSVIDDGISIIPIHGTLVHRTHGLSAMSGLTSYNRIRSQFTTALNDPNIHSILLDIDSPGGEVAGAFDLVDTIYFARGVKPIIATINERGYSAAYAIASAADAIYLSRTAGVGSIGVVMLHVDRSEANKKAGITYTPIYAGDHKLDGSPNSPLSKTARDIAQATVNTMYDLFVATVARNNGMSEQTIRNTQAGTYHGQSAIESGLADAVLSYQEVINQLTTKKGGNRKIMPTRKAVTPEPTKLTEPTVDSKVINDPSTEPVVNQAIAAPSAPPAPPALTQSDVDFAIATERDRCISIIEACNIANVKDSAIDMISDGSTIETVHKLIMTVLAERSASTSVRSAVNPAQSGATNPLLAYARRRAEAAKAGA